MKHTSTIRALVLLIAVLAGIATAMGIFSNEGAGPYEYMSIRGKAVTIYGKGLYKDMSAEVAPQGIAQDYVTLLIGIPLLLLSFLLASRGSLQGRYLLSGTLGYFLVTYLFYTVMGMYNQFFLAYVVLMGASFYAFLLLLLPFNTSELSTVFKAATPIKATGGFLMFTAIAIAFLWLGIVVPPLFDGTIVPVEAAHYTTLIVQGLDLGILLPAGFLCSILWIRKAPLGYLLAPVYFVFLSLLMCALTAKVIAMLLLGYNTVPAIFIIPVFNIFSLISTFAILNNIDEPRTVSKTKHYEEKIFS